MRQDSRGGTVSPSLKVIVSQVLKAVLSERFQEDLVTPIVSVPEISRCAAIILAGNFAWWSAISVHRAVNGTRVVSEAFAVDL